MKDAELYALAVLVNGEQLRLNITNRELQSGNCFPVGESPMALVARCALESELTRRGVLTEEPSP